LEQYGRKTKDGVSTHSTSVVLLLQHTIRLNTGKAGFRDSSTNSSKVGDIFRSGFDRS